MLTHHRATHIIEHFLAGLRTHQGQQYSSRPRQRTILAMAASLQTMNSWVQFALAGWARKQADDRLATLWKQLTVARSHYKPGVDSLDSANALAVRLEAVRTEIERRGGLPQETFEPSPWYKGVDERASWTLTDFTILPPDTEFSVQSQSLALPWPPLDTTSGTTLPGSASKPDDILGAFLNLDDATIQGIKEIADASEPNLFLDPIDDITQTDPYQAYRVSDNDLSGCFMPDDASCSRHLVRYRPVLLGPAIRFRSTNDRWRELVHPNPADVWCKLCANSQQLDQRCNL